MMAHPEHLHGVLKAIDAAASDCKLLVVPGGGPFAEAVRDVDRRLGLEDTAAHWMAVLAMDQYAQLIVSRLANGVLVTDAGEIGAALATGHIPILAPYRWLREADPLPHSWDVTSDSIAAWVAGQLGARRLVLVKPAGASGDLVDSYFPRALPVTVTPEIVTADRIEALAATLSRSNVAPTV
jgi:aspartokinase-like uncharacterized kinase